MATKIFNSTISRKLSGVFIALVLVFSLAMGGCSTPVSAAEVNESAIASYAKVSSLRMNITMQMDMGITADGKTQNMTADMEGAALIDNANKQLQMTMNMDMDIPELGKQNFTLEEYLVSDYVYMKMNLPGAGEQWMKMKMPEGMWATQNQADQQIELLKSASQIELLADEKVDGVDCYVEKIIPDMGQLFDWAMSQMQSTGAGAPGMDKLDMGEMFKNVVIKVWVAKNSRLIMKEEIYMEMDITPEDVGEAGDKFGGVTAKISGQMKFSDYDKPVSIVLPPEAAGAMEVPGMK